MATPFPTIAISQASSRSTRNEINVVRFGNGYEQRVPMGINYKRDVWQVTWEGLTSAEKTTIVNFLEAISDGSYTNWTTPYDAVSKKFVLDGEWSIQDIGGNIYAVSCTLRQVYDLA